MNRCIVLTFLVVSVLFENRLFAAQTKGMFPADHMYVTSLNLSAHSRFARYEFSDKRNQTVKLDPIVMYGFGLGKRFALRSQFRVYIPFDVTIGAGSEKVPELIEIRNYDGNIYLVEVALKRYYYAIGCTPQVHYRIPTIDKKNNFFLSAGGGILYVVFNEKERMVDKNVFINDSYLDTDDAVSISLDLGAGIDMLLSKTRCLALVYGFRLWRPINYLTSRDLFPVLPVRYSETFYSHAIAIQFLLRVSTSTR